MEKNNTVKQAGGFIIQLMPYAEETVITALEERLKSFSSVTTLLNEGMTPEDMMGKLFEGFDYQINTNMPTSFHCGCSKEHFAKALVCIGKKDLEDMIKDNEPIEVNCQFCGSHYVYGVEELKEFAAKAQ